MTRKPPEDCRNMAELRAQIDGIDRDLIALLAERVGHIDRAVQLKPAEGIKANAPDRVAAVIANVRAEAEAAGFDPDLAEALWRPMIDWAIARERRHID